jgi:hypothetical protein
MALWPNHAQLLDTMESEISPITANPLSNTVFHARADIRIESTSIDPPIESQDWGSQQLLEHGRPKGEEEHAIQERAAEMQSWWDDAIARNMNLPDGYQEAAVLIIKWDDELDELKTRDEVSYFAWYPHQPALINDVRTRPRNLIAFSVKSSITILRPSNLTFPKSRSTRSADSSAHLSRNTMVQIT